jgi:hypothetical protein
LANFTTLEIASTFRLEFTTRIVDNAEKGGRDCRAEHKCAKCDTSVFYTSANEARR